MEASKRMAGNGTKWLDDPTDLYITSEAGSVEGFCKPDGERATDGQSDDTSLPVPPLAPRPDRLASLAAQG